MPSISLMRPLSFIAIVYTAFFMVPAVTAISATYGQVGPACHDSGPPILRSFSELYEASNRSLPVVIECGYQYTVEGGTRYRFPAGLEVKGDLIFEDGPPSSFIIIEAAYILVRGKLRAGTENSPFQRRLTFVLRDHIVPNSILSVENFSGNTLFDGKFNFGKKAFVVLGGTIELYGTESTGPSHFHLAQSVNMMDTMMHVKGDVSHWKMGDKLAIATGSRDMAMDSLVEVREVIYSNTLGQSEVHLTNPIPNTHNIRTFRYKRPGGGDGTTVAAPAVAKINRNIRIFGRPLKIDLEGWITKKKVKEGGHFIIANSAGKQVLQGVEFVLMGQAGVLGRYPLHFHFGGDVHPGSRFSYNSIHHSQQRCIVVHATNKLLVDNNVAFRSRGHCFMTEDGMEVDNVFRGNIGIGIRKARKLIDEDSSDHRPAVFWMSSPTNDIIDNVAAGSASSGFWYEGFTKVLGLSLKTLPGGETYVPNRAKVGKFISNVAHSTRSGLKSYPLPIRPPLENPAQFQNFLTWSVGHGYRFKIGSNQILSNATMLDIYERGVDFQRQHGAVIEDTVIVGTDFENLSCDTEAQAIYLLAEYNYSLWSSGLGPTTIRNVHIENFKNPSDCEKNNIFGIYIDFPFADRSFPSATSFERITYSDVDVKMRLNVSEEYRNSTVNQQFAFQISDASVDSVAPDKVGYVLSDNFKVGEDVLKEGCDSNTINLPKDTNLLFCEGQCWRHASFAYKRDKSLKAEFVKFTFGDEGQKSFIVNPDRRNAFNGLYNRIVTKLLPSGIYHLTLLDKSKMPISPELYNETSFYVSYTDERRGRPACDEPIVLTVGDMATVLKQSPLLEMDVGEIDALEDDTD